MKLPLSWLKEFVEIKISPEKLAEELTMTGQEVESVESALNFKGVVIGEVLEVKDHPNADRLHVAKVNVGKETLQIVCGAPNLAEGQKVPVALVGAKLEDFEIGKASLRGVESFGMICSEKELGLGEDHSGILVLEENAPVGKDFGEFLGKDSVIDIKIAANRPDCMSVIGLARETAATLNEKLKVSKLVLNENGSQKTADLVEVEVKNKDLCPRYMSRVVKNVKISPSPDWMQKRLIESGVRPINNLVDISNYVMLEYGQPLHIFDLNKLSKKGKAKIIVRNAEKGEEMVTLDGVKRKLTPEMLAIADTNGVVALAGVMGGENSEVDEKTTDILIEAAVFDKASIRRTSRALGLRSEAVARFEKGLPVRLPEFGIERCAELVQELASGEVCKGVVDELAEKLKIEQIILDTDRANRFLGTKIGEKEIISIFDRLEFRSKLNGRKVEVEVPWWRVDLKNETDLFEEIARIWGYQNIPSTLPEASGEVPAKNLKFDLDWEIRKLLSDIGFTEILTYSFVSKKELTVVGADVTVAPKVANPLVLEQEFLRTTTIPQLLKSLSENQFHKESVKFFEIGRTYQMAKGELLPKEERVLSMGVTDGNSWPINYGEDNSFYIVKGALERLFANLGINQQKVEFKAEGEKTFAKGKSAVVFINNEKAGTLGMVSPQTAENFGLKKEAAVLELSLDKIFKWAQIGPKFEEISKFPKVTRDISAVFDMEIEAGKIVSEIAKSDSLVKKVEVIDIYRGKPLEKGEKSVTVRIEFRSMEKTLTDTEVDAIMEKIIKKIAELGGKIRGGKES